MNQGHTTWSCRIGEGSCRQSGEDNGGVGNKKIVVIPSDKEDGEMTPGQGLSVDKDGFVMTRNQRKRKKKRRAMLQKGSDLSDVASGPTKGRQ